MRKLSREVGLYLALTHQPERKTERRNFIPERDVYVMGVGYFSTWDRGDGEISKIDWLAT